MNRFEYTAARIIKGGPGKCSRGGKIPRARNPMARTNNGVKFRHSSPITNQLEIFLKILFSTCEEMNPLEPREKPQKISRAEKEEKEPLTERRESWSVLRARGLPGRCTGHGEVWSPLSGPFPRWFVRVLRSVCGVRAGYLRLLGRFRFRLVAQKALADWGAALLSV